MLAPVALLAFAALAAILGPHLLLRAEWVQRAPGWGVLAWQGLTASIVACVALFGLALAAPLSPLADQLARLCRTTTPEVVEHYMTPAGTWLTHLAVLGLAALVLRLSWMTAATVTNTVRGRRAQLRLLQLLGREHDGGFVVIDHARPLVYCLPGLRQRVVVTSAALQALAPLELELVLAHERSHLRSRHDIALIFAQVLRRAFGPLRVFRTAHEQIAILVEMQADDAARDPHCLARALVTLGCGAPQPGLAAGDVAAVARVKRLTGPADPWSPRTGMAVFAGTLALLAVPMLLALTPMIGMVLTGCETVLG